jgi:hypothetical protein
MAQPSQFYPIVLLGMAVAVGCSNASPDFPLRNIDSENRESDTLKDDISLDTETDTMQSPTTTDDVDCVPGRAIACACDSGGLGVKTCSNTGIWGICEGCLLGCVPGDAARCPCLGGDEGTQSCEDDGTWGPCEGCETACVPSTRQTCACEDGSAGVRECLDSGEGWSPCRGCAGDTDFETGETPDSDTRDAPEDTASSDDTDSDTDAPDDTATGRGTDTMSDQDTLNNGDTSDIEHDTDSTSDSAPDSDTAEDSETGPGECDYTEDCIGAVCSASEACCDATICGDVVFGDTTNGILENYCYPACDTTLADPCQCDDACVNINDDTAACLGLGRIAVNHLTLCVGTDFSAVRPIDAGSVDFTADLRGAPLPFIYFYAYWDEHETADGATERGLYIRAEGPSSRSTLWLFYIYLPEALFADGGGDIPIFNEQDGAFNFDLEVQSATIDSDDRLTDGWVEGLVNDAVLSVENTCAPCAVEDDTCEPCTFSFDAELFVMRAKLL